MRRTSNEGKEPTQRPVSTVRISSNNPHHESFLSFLFTVVPMHQHLLITITINIINIISPTSQRAT
jgi:hypothetical protein